MKQRSTCRWCRRPIERASAASEWKSGFFGGGGDRECPDAPNPYDGPMPGHEPGTAVVSEDGSKHHVRYCDANARRGTGTGICDRPLDEIGQCDRASDHLRPA